MLKKWVRRERRDFPRKPQSLEEATKRNLSREIPSWAGEGQG